MKKIVVMGSISIDLIIEVDKVPVIGETVMGRNYTQAFGGKGANQAVAVARLGLDASFIGTVGSDSAGEALIKSLHDNGVNTDYMAISKDKPTGTAVIILYKGDNYIAVDIGANMEVLNKQVDDATEIIKHADMVVTQLETPYDTVKHLLQKCNAYNIPVILNPAPAPSDKFDKSLLAMASIITPNESETYALTGIMAKTPDDGIKAAKRLSELGAKQIVITLGELGCIYGSGTDFKHFPAIHVPNVVDTTGAGDSFTAALAVALTDGETLEQAIRFATKVASITIQTKGSQPSLPYRHQII